MLKSIRSIVAGITILTFLTLTSIYYHNPMKGLTLISLAPRGISGDERQSSKTSYHASHITGSEDQNTLANMRWLRERTQDVHNETLGFEQIMLLNLPERTDKLDGFALAASLAGFTFSVIAGVRGDDVSNKSLPALAGIPSSNFKAKQNIIGCWRGHMNFARHIVQNGLSSALIIEDDSDWDTHLKQQLELFAQGSQFVTNSQKNVPKSPYGDDWDLLWLGHCAIGIAEKDKCSRRFVIENDPTVPHVSRRVNYQGVPNMNDEGYDNSTRIVFHADQGCCMYSYALSARGARKVLYHESTTNKLDPIDFALSDMCKAEGGLKCIGTFPQLFSSHRTAGATWKDSDMSSEWKDTERKKADTPNIVYSLKLNTQKLLEEGEGTEPERQWPEDPVIAGPPRLRTYDSCD